jgi:hypothetical protein
MDRWKKIVALALVLGLPGCVRWKAVPVPTPPAPPNVVSDQSRVRLNNGQAVGFLTLVVASDSIFGVRNNDARTRLTISHDQVRRIEVRQKDPVKTLGLLGGLAFGLWYSGAMGLGPNR